MHMHVSLTHVIIELIKQTNALYLNIASGNYNFSTNYSYDYRHFRIRS